MAFGRYLAVGAVATGVHYLVLLILVEKFGRAAPISAVIGAVCGALVAYAGNWRFTFRHAASHGQALPRFLVVAAGGAAANGLIVWVGTAQLGLYYLLAQLIATVLVVVATFQVNRAWSFE